MNQGLLGGLCLYQYLNNQTGKDRKPNGGRYIQLAALSNSRLDMFLTSLISIDSLGLDSFSLYLESKLHHGLHLNREERAFHASKYAR